MVPFQALGCQAFLQQGLVWTDDGDPGTAIQDQTKIDIGRECCGKDAGRKFFGDTQPGFAEILRSVENCLRHRFPVRVGNTEFSLGGKLFGQVRTESNREKPTCDRRSKSEVFVKPPPSSSTE